MNGRGGDDGHSVGGGWCRHPPHRSWGGTRWVRLECVNKQAPNLSGLKAGIGTHIGCLSCMFNTGHQGALPLCHSKAQPEGTSILTLALTINEAENGKSGASSSTFPMGGTCATTALV